MPRTAPTNVAASRASPTTPRSPSTWNATLCGSDACVASILYRSRAIAYVPAPEPPSGLSRAMWSDSFHQAMRLLAHRSASRPGALAHSPPENCDDAQENGSPTFATSPTAPPTSTTAHETISTVRTSRSRSPTRRRIGELPRRDRDSERHEQGQHGEDPAVRDPVGAQHPVVDERGSCERPGADREAGACEDDQPEGVDQPLPAQHEPEDDDRDGAARPLPVTG